MCSFSYPDVTIYNAMPLNSPEFSTFWGKEEIQLLKHIGKVFWNRSSSPPKADELSQALEDVDILVAGWGCPQLTEDILQKADKLRLVVYSGGSVHSLVSPELYQRGITVLSGNQLFARSVAEGVIAYMLCAQRKLHQYGNCIAQGVWPSNFYNYNLRGKRVGLLGYGMVVRELIPLLKAFHCDIRMWLDYTPASPVERDDITIVSSLEELFSECEIVSVHCGMRSELFHLVDETLLQLLPLNALFLNTARGQLVDTEALCRVFSQRNDLRGVLDVYEREPLPATSPLTKLSNLLLIPHMAGPTIEYRRTVMNELLLDIMRFTCKQPVHYCISAQYAQNMSNQ